MLSDENEASGPHPVKTSDESEKNTEEQAFPSIKSKVEILDILFHPSENSIIYAGLINGKLKIYDLTQNKKKNILRKAQKLHKKSIRQIAFAENNPDLLFTASKDKSIKLTDIKHESNVLTLEKAHESSINCLKTIDHWLIASGDDDGCVKIWDYRRKNACMESKEDCSDYISDLAVSNDKKTLLATCGEGTLNAFSIKKKKLQLQSELMDSELLCVKYVKNDKKAVVGTGEGVLDIFNNEQWGNISDRFPGHPSSIDSIAVLTNDIILTGCFDGNIRACYILPNRFLGIVGGHDGSPVQKLALSSESDVCASIGHDEQIRFWQVENLKSRRIDAQSKSKNNSLKNKKLNAKGKSENFFADLADNNEEDNDIDSSDDDDDDDNDGGNHQDISDSSDDSDD